MAERERPGEIRVHRSFLKADGVQALWPEGVRVTASADRILQTPPLQRRGSETSRT